MAEIQSESNNNSCENTHNIEQLFEIAQQPKYINVLRKCSLLPEKRALGYLSALDLSIIYDFMALFSDSALIRLRDMMDANGMKVHIRNIRHICIRDEAHHRVGDMRKIAIIMRNPNNLQVTTCYPSMTEHREEIDQNTNERSKIFRHVYLNMVKLNITTPYIIAGVTGLNVSDVIKWSENDVSTVNTDKIMTDIIRAIIGDAFVEKNE